MHYKTDASYRNGFHFMFCKVMLPGANTETILSHQLVFGENNGLQDFHFDGLTNGNQYIAIAWFSTLQNGS